MDDRTTRDLLTDLQSLKRDSVRLRKGVVTDTDPLAVALGGSDVSYVGVAAIDGLALVTGDVVSVLARGNDLLVVGRTGPGILRGTIAADGSITAGAGFSVNKPSTGNYDVTFDVEYPTIPVIVAAPGSTDNFGTRLSTVSPPSTTGFRVIGVNPFAASDAAGIKDGVIQFFAMPA